MLTVIIGKVVNATTLMTFGGFVGNIGGGLIGGTVANSVANKVIADNSMDFNEVMESGVTGEIPLWFIRFFRWLFA